MSRLFFLLAAVPLIAAVSPPIITTAPPSDPQTEKPEGCDFPLYCTNESSAAYPEKEIRWWVQENHETYKELYDDVILYPEAGAGLWPRKHTGEEMCDTIEDYPYLYWAFTFPHGWLPIIQTSKFPQFLRTERCHSSTCNAQCTKDECVSSSSCGTVESRVRLLAWDGKKAISTRALIPTCCKCFLGEIAPTPAPEPTEKPKPFCDECDSNVNLRLCLKICIPRPTTPSTPPPFCDECVNFKGKDYVWCKRKCVERPTTTTPAAPPTTTPIYCDTCNPKDPDYLWCIKFCVQRTTTPASPTLPPCHTCIGHPDYLWCLKICVKTPPTTTPAAPPTTTPLYCDTCSTHPDYLWCIKLCVSRPPAEPSTQPPLYCDTCPGHPDYLWCIKLCIPRPPAEPTTQPPLYCDTCPTHPDYPWCIKLCIPRPPAEPTTQPPLYCDTCPGHPDYPWCIKFCIPRPPAEPTTPPLYCDTCPTNPDYVWCIKKCVQRPPAEPEPVYCDTCPTNPDPLWCLKKCVQRPNYCDLCNPTDADYEWCIQKCVCRVDGKAKLYCDICAATNDKCCQFNCIPRNGVLPSTPASPKVFCDQCDVLDQNYKICKKTCVKRTPSDPPTCGCSPYAPDYEVCVKKCNSGNGNPFDPAKPGRSCDFCLPYSKDWEWCIKACVCRRPALNPPCGACLALDDCCGKHCDPTVNPVKYCYQCRSDPDPAWCRKTCLDVPAECSCDFNVFGELCKIKEFVCFPQDKKRRFVRLGMGGSDCVLEWCGPFTGKDLMGWMKCIRTKCTTW